MALDRAHIAELRAAVDDLRKLAGRASGLSRYRLRKNIEALERRIQNMEHRAKGRREIQAEDLVDLPF